MNSSLKICELATQLYDGLDVETSTKLDIEIIILRYFVDNKLMIMKREEFLQMISRIQELSKDNPNA